MDHAPASLLLADYVDGRLDEARGVKVRAHLDRCDECREWTETYGLLAGALATEEGGSNPAHPAAEEIALFCIEPERLAGENLQRLARHLARCPSCSEEVASTRQAASEAREEIRRRFDAARPAPWRFTGPGLRLAVAASLAVAALGLSAYLGFLRIPRIREDARDLRAQTDRLRVSVHQLEERLRLVTEWSGPVGYLLLGDALRGGEPVPTLRLRPGQPYLSVAVQPALPDEVRGEDRCRFEIRSAAGDPVWGMDLSASSIHEELSAYEVVFLQIPASRLPPGAYQMRLVRARDGEEELLLQAPFAVEPAR